MANTCPQIKDAGKITNPITPQGCQECLKTGDSWVHLRLCLECGHVGCCDNSKNKHATRHFHQTGHPVIISSLQLPQGIFMVLILCILSSFKSCSDRLEGLVSRVSGAIGTRGLNIVGHIGRSQVLNRTVIVLNKLISYHDSRIQIG